MRARLVSIAGLVAGVLFLGLATRSIEISDLWAKMLAANSRALIATCAAFAAFIGVKAWRWRFLLKPLGSLRTRTLIAPVVVGLAGNAVVPHSGEVARSYLLGREARLPLSPLLATIAVERVFDFVAVLALLGIAALFEPRLPHALLTAAYAVALMAAVLLAVVIALLWRPESSMAVLTKATSFLPGKAQGFVLGELGKGMRGLEAVKSPSLLAAVVALSMLQWSLMAATAYFAAAAYQPRLPLSAGVAVLALTVVGLTAPTAPGYVGTIQLCFTLGLAGYAVAEVDAVAASIVFNAVVTMPVMAATVPLVHHLGYRVRDVAKVDASKGGEPKS